MQTVYVDTSVFGGCFDEEFQEWSNALMESFAQGNRICVLSDLVLLELEQAPKHVRQALENLTDEAKLLVFVDEEIKALARTYIAEGAVTEKYFNDAMHIALATIHKVDVLISWNFKHIVNLNRIRIFNAVNLKSGYSVLEIRSPREILES